MDGEDSVFTRAQALDRGHTPAAIRHRLQTGRWIVLRHGVYVGRSVYAAAGPVARHALRVAAALLALEVGDAVASHASAALLHGLRLAGGTPHQVVLSRPPGPAGRLQVRGVHLHRARLPSEHLSYRLGVPVTTAARTVVDLARTPHWRDAVVVADSAMQLGRATREDLDRVLDDCRGWPRIARARRVIAFADGGAESVLESYARVAFAEHGLPPPRTQVPIGDPPFARVDFLWPEYDTIVETDGLVKYDDRGALHQEKLRQERLEELGYKVVRLTWRQVVREPEHSAARIRAAYGFAPGRGLRLLG